jgi:hypothetical protein
MTKVVAGLSDIIKRHSKRLAEHQELERAQEQRISLLEASIINMLAVFDSLDVYDRYKPVRDDARAALERS